VKSRDIGKIRRIVSKNVNNHKNQISSFHQKKIQRNLWIQMSFWILIIRLNLIILTSIPLLFYQIRNASYFPNRKQDYENYPLKDTGPQLGLNCLILFLNEDLEVGGNWVKSNYISREFSTWKCNSCPGRALITCRTCNTCLCLSCCEESHAQLINHQVSFW